MDNRGEGKEGGWSSDNGTRRDSRQDDRRGDSPQDGQGGNSRPTSPSGYQRDDRPRDDRPRDGQGGDRRPSSPSSYQRDDRPRSDRPRDDRPRDDRPRSDRPRDDRPRDDRPRSDRPRDDRPRDDRPRSDRPRDDRPRDDRPRSDRPRDDRPRDDRPRDDRPRSDRPRDDRPRDDRPRSDRPRDDRPRDDRPRSDRPRDDRPRDDRPPRERPPRDRPRDDRPRDDRGAKPFDRDRKPFDRDAKPFDRDRKPFDRDRKPFDRDRKPAAPREGGFRNRDVAAISDIDEELLRMIMRRARVLAKLRVGDRLDSAVEKVLRTSWEEKAAHHSRDSRIARELFVLLQSVEPLSRYEEEQSFFNLAPRREPVNLTMPAPADSATVRSWLALAAASGQKLEMHGISLTDNIIDAVKAFNQLGGQLWWEEDGTILSRGSKGLTSGIDKVIHVGDDAFNFWLVLALSLGLPSRLKLTGGSSLRFLDLAPVRHFLIDMGARLTNVIPSQDGLPVRVECSGMVPQEVRLPSTLPAGFVAALVLAAPFWERPVRMFVPSYSIGAVDAALLLLNEAGARASRDNDVVSVSPGPLTLPAEPRIAADVPFAASLLAIPAFVGGTVRLDGVWPMRRSDTDRVAQAEKLLRAAGVELTIENGFVSSSRTLAENERAAVSWRMTGEESAELLRCAPELLPLLSALSSASALQGTTSSLGVDGETGGTVLSGFLARLGLILADNGVLSTTMMVMVEPEAPEVIESAQSAEFGDAGEVPESPESADSANTSESPESAEFGDTLAIREPVEETPLVPVILEEREESVPQERSPWISPSPLWAVGMALAAFARPHIHLANPGVMTELFPTFWNLYNGLPKPDLNRAKQVEEVDVKPVRRRIIAQGVYGDVPPDAIVGDGDWH